MATEDRFDITEWFKLIKDREVACKSNDEMTETKSPYQLQQIQTSRYRPQPRSAVPNSHSQNVLNMEYGRCRT